MRRFAMGNRQAQNPENTFLEGDGELHTATSHSFTIPPKLALPFKHKTSQDTRPQLLDTPSKLQLQDKPVLYSLQQQNDQKKGRNRRAIKPIHLVSPAEEAISHLDTMLMFAVRPGEVQQQQQNILVNAMVDDITRRTT